MLVNEILVANKADWSLVTLFGVPIACFFGSVLSFYWALLTRRALVKILHHLFLLILAYYALSTSKNWASPLDSLWQMMLMVWVSHSTSILWLEKSNPIAIYQPEEKCAQGVVTCECHTHVVLRGLWNNPRLLGRFLHAAQTSLMLFTLRKVGKIAIHYCVAVHIIPQIFPGLFAPVQYNEFDSLHQTYLRRLFVSDSTGITARETCLRSFWAFYWAWMTFAMLDTAHAVLSITSVVVLRLDRPEDWPPLFGSLSEAFTIRRFWSRFWHKIVVWPYSNFGRLASRRIVGLRPDSKTEKMLVFFTVFFFSGVAHGAVAWWSLGECAYWTRDVAWFCGNFAAGALEVVFLRMARFTTFRMGWGKQWRRLGQNSQLVKALGFLWVFSFFFWSVPKWQYPKLDCAIAQATRRLAREL